MATFVVTNAGDVNDGVTVSGSLRSAIEAANANPGPDRIEFQIQTVRADPVVIGIFSPLPDLSDPVVIDGYTQFGASANTQPIGTDAVLKIVLAAATDTIIETGLVASSPTGGVEIRGLVFDGFGTSDIEIFAPGTIIAGNYLGTDDTGLAASFTASEVEVGIRVGPEGVGSRIGGVAPADRNVISGNLGRGIEIRGGSGVQVLGNYIGVNASGAAALGNGGDGVLVSAALPESEVVVPTVSSVVIANNVITGNGGNGVILSSDNIGTTIESNVVAGNTIGSSADGTAALGNVGFGVVIGDRAFRNEVGGPNPGDRNVIGGNGGGILFDGSEGSGNRVRNNAIGFRPNGVPLGNRGDGVRIDSLSGNEIGGTGPTDGNVIAFNRGRGVAVIGGTSNRIAGNSIYENTELGIELIAGGNTGLAPPELLIAVEPTIRGRYRGAPNTTYVIEVFRSSTADPSGSGEGQFFVGRQTITTDGTGEGEFTQSVAIDPQGPKFFTATATDPAGNTSDFSLTLARGHASDLAFQLTTNPANGLVPVAGTLTVTASIVNLGTTASEPAFGTLMLPFTGPFQPSLVGIEAIREAGVTTTVRADGSAIDFTLDPLAPNASAGFEVDLRVDVAGPLGFNGSVLSANDFNLSNNFPDASATGIYTFIVTNTNNSGLGSFRQTLVNAANHPGGETITFAIPGAGPHRISPRFALPDLFGGTVIDATTQPGYDGLPVVELRGDGLIPSQDDPSATFNGLTLRGDSNIVRGLAVTSFSGSGITIQEGGGNAIVADLLGTDRSGVSGLGNGLQGLTINGRGGNLVGPFAAAAANVISGNRGGGVLVGGGSGNTIAGNRIGTDAAGGVALGNEVYGLALSRSNANLVTLNQISGNDGDGVSILGGPGGLGSFNRLTRNRIGTDDAGLVALPNSGDGVSLFGASSNQIGLPTTAPEFSNLIAGNLGNGIKAIDSYQTGIFGNRIGVDATGTRALPNLGGVAIGGAALETLVGAPIPGGGNLISGNDQFGVYLAGSTGVGLFGNRIGTSADGASAVPNSVSGVFLENAPGNTIGGPAAGAGNLIAGNGQVEIVLAEPNTLGTVVQGNEIGPGRLGSDAPLAGIFLVRTGSVVIGGLNLGEGNRIAGNRVGIDVFQSFSNRIVGNVIGIDAAGSAIRGNVHGVLVRGGLGNHIGERFDDGGNVISGNGTNGVWLFGGDTSGTVIEANAIGTDRTGSVAVPNGVSGVFIDGSGGNLIGGADTGASNLISGNGQVGVAVVGPSAAGNVIAGNRIGTDRAGSTAIPNGLAGLFISDAASTLVGGAGPLDGNTISGNGGAGVQVFGLDSMNTLLLGNRIGTAADGVSPLGNEFGVFFNTTAPVFAPTAGPGANTIAFNSGGDLVSQAATPAAIAATSLVPGPGSTRRFTRQTLAARRRGAQFAR